MSRRAPHDQFHAEPFDDGTRLKKAFCVEKKHVRVAEPDVTLHFSDADAGHAANLKNNIGPHLCDQGCCKLDIRPMAFAEAFSEALPVLRDKGRACTKLHTLDPIRIIGGKA